MTLAIVGGIALSCRPWATGCSPGKRSRHAAEVAKAIVKTDMKPVIDLSVPGTEMDSMRWYNDIYKQYMDLKLALGGQDAGVTVEPPRSTPKAARPRSYVLFSKAGSRFDGSIFYDVLAAKPDPGQRQAVARNPHSSG